MDVLKVEHKSLEDSFNSIKGELTSCLAEMSQLAISNQKLLLETEQLLDKYKVLEFKNQLNNRAIEIENLLELRDISSELDHLLRYYNSLKKLSAFLGFKEQQLQSTISTLSSNNLFSIQQLSDILDILNLIRQNKPQDWSSSERANIISILFGYEAKLFSHLNNMMQSLWARLVVLEKSNSQTLTMKLVFSSKYFECYCNIMLASKHKPHFKQFLISFFQDLHQNFVKPILISSSSLEIIRGSDCNETNCVNFIKLNSGGDSLTKTDSKLVLGYLEAFYMFLDDFFFSHPLMNWNEREKCFDSAISSKFFLCDSIMEALCNDLISLHLRPNLPSSYKEFHQFMSSTHPTILSFIDKIRFIFYGDEKPHTSSIYLSSLCEYVQNVKEIYGKRMTEVALERARKLLSGDLLTLVNVDECSSSQLITFITTSDSQDFRLSQDFIAQTSNNFYEDPVLNDFFKSSLNEDFQYLDCTFAGCQISQSFVSLSAYMFELMAEIFVERDDFDFNSRNLDLIRSVLRLVLCVSPSMHNKPVTDIPQVHGLMFNNYNFISRITRLLAFYYFQKIAIQKESLENGSETLVDFCPLFQDLAISTLNAAIQQHCAEIRNFIQSEVPFVNLSESHHRSFNKVQFYIFRLSSVWKVLPKNDYKASISRIISAFLNAIFEVILDVDDISENDSKIWSQLLDTVHEKLANIFDDSKNPERGDVAAMKKLQDLRASEAIPEWKRLLELKFMLTSNLQLIKDRWCSGKGPIAQHWKPREVRKLIKALFADSDIRSMTLKSIR